MGAAEFAAEAHAGQQRHNGDPYITHPVKVAEIVSDWKLDQDAVIAALLHDVVEDTSLSAKDIDEKFGAGIGAIVNGMSKIKQIEQFEGSSYLAERTDTPVTIEAHKASASFRKLLLAISRDWRVILIKLADRLHNMRTLANIYSRAKRKRIARETLDIYAPIAERLGFPDTCSELQRLAFEHIYPLRHAVLTAAMQRSQRQARKTIPKIKRSITNAMKSTKVKATIAVREKNIYSVYRKMFEKKLSFTEVDDILGFRLITNTRLECYITLGVIHELFRPVPDKLKDYISQPKTNGYQSIHTTVLTPNGSLVELQLRDWMMHRHAEFGLAAHWDYKDLSVGPKANRKRLPKKIQEHTNHMLNNLMVISSYGLEPGEFLRNMRLDLFPNEVIVLTPQGKVVELIKGATVLDMAYQIHTDLGDKAASAIINGEQLPISASLVSGDIVKIITSENTSPNPQWLNFVVTPKARSHLRAKLKQSYSEEMASLGHTLLDRSLRRNGYSIEELNDGTINKFLHNSYSSNSKEELYTEIALGKLSAEIIAKEILGPHRHRQKRQEELSISIAGDQHYGIVRASCCEPLPPEKIVGLMQKNRGLVIHRMDCNEVAAQVKANKHVSLHWNSASKDNTYRVSLTLGCTNRQGLLANVLAKFPAEGINIVSINLGGAEQSNPVATIALEVEVGNAQQIERLISRMNAISGVSVTRAGAGLPR